jgi:hypothetical protein
MHARELVELAALLSLHGPALIESRKPIPASSLEEYWVASKSRLDRWGRSLKSLSSSGRAGSTSRGCQRPLVRAVLEEILLSELLTRVWGAVACAWDRRLGTDEAEPIARSVLVGHMEARHRVLTLLVRTPAIDADYAVKLNRLRRRSERWSDMLIGHLVEEMADVAEFAAEPERANEFARDLRDQSRQPGGRYARPLVMASLRAAFRQGLAPESPNADLNSRIAGSILSAFPPELFDATGAFRSAWLVRLTSFTDDAKGAIDELLEADGRLSRGDVPSPTCRRLADRLRRFE